MNLPATKTRLVLDHLALMALVGVATALSLAWTRLPGHVAAVWIGSGLVTGWLLSRPTRQWPGLLAAAVLAEALVRQSFALHHGREIGLGIANLLEILAVAWTVRRRVPDLGNAQDWMALGGIATIATLVGCALSATLAALVVSLTGDERFLPNFLTWYTAHAVGMVILPPLIVVMHREKPWAADTRRRADLVACMLVLAAVAAAVFTQSRYPLLFLTYPPLLWCTFRHRFLGVVLGIALLALIGGAATALGHGPLVALHMEAIGNLERIVVFQLFLGAGCLMTFPIALAMAQRRQLLRRVRSGEMRYRMLADYTHDVVVRVDDAGARIYVSPSVTETLGWAPEDLVGTHLDIVHPEDRPIREEMLSTVRSTRVPSTWVFRSRHKDGRYLWMESAARLIPNADDPKRFDVVFAARDITRRVEAEQALRASKREVEALARSDVLTGLANRRQFDERFARALARTQRARQPLALLLMDIDAFKQINDRHGHAVGDEVLRTFAGRLSDCVRSTDLVARLGGDEFAVLVEDAGLPEAAEAIARKLIAGMARPMVVAGGVDVDVTTSIGIAFAVQPPDQDTLVRAADAALYAAKRAGRNCFELVRIPPEGSAPA